MDLKQASRDALSRRLLAQRGLVVRAEQVVEQQWRQIARWQATVPHLTGLA